jgi:CBS domain containing-hemolysin-like protein
MHLLFLITAFSLCLFGTFFYAGAETGFVSWNPLKVSHRAGQGDPVARIALYLMNHQDRVISATLIGSNVSIIGATLLFVKLFEIAAASFSIDITHIPSAESWILTPLMVLFCEMLPKSLFRTYSFRLTMRSIPFLFITYILTFPFTWVITYITGHFKRDRKAVTQDSFTAKVREEMVLIAGEGSRRGTLFESADKYIQSVLNLKEQSVADLMIGFEDIAVKCTTSGISSHVGELKKNGLRNDEIIIIDESSGVPLGTVDLTDVANTPDSTPVFRFMKPLLKIRSSASVLAVLLGGVQSVSNYISIINDDGKVSGIIEKTALFRAVFGGLEVNLFDI